MNALRCLLHLVILLAVGLLTGCVSQFSKREITPLNVSPLHQHSGTVLVSASGGGKTEMKAFDLAMFNVEDQSMQDAIVDSIISSGLFSRAVTVGNADYQLDVLLVLIEQPPVSGFTMKSGTRTIWKLTRLKDHKQIFQDEIVSQDRETVGDHFVGSTRQRAAVTGAIQKNIQAGIEKIGEIEF
jgi:hypothetical protein